MIKIPKIPASRGRQKMPFVVAQANGGIVTQSDPNDIHDNQFQVCTNATIRNDVTSRLIGSIVFPVAAPDGNRVLDFTEYERYDGTILLMRHTPSTLYKFDGTNFINIVIAPALMGGGSDRISHTVFNDGYYFANNGKDPIQSVNATANTCAPLGNAPKYRYVTNCFNRIVGANLNAGGAGNNPVQIGWSGDTNPIQWDPLVDVSAGSTPIIEAGADLADPINGVFGYTWGMIIPRERSVWVATKQPSATNPFFFYCAAPNIGCDVPFSVAQIPNGIAFLSLRNNNIFMFTPTSGQNGSASVPVPIGTDIRNALTSRIDNINNVYSSYNSYYNEYTIGVLPASSNVASIWTYNFYNKSWTYQERTNVINIAANDYLSITQTIGQLIGQITNLNGTIANLGVAAQTSTNMYCRTDGTIWIETLNQDTDPSGSYTMKVVSKNFNIPTMNAEVGMLNFELFWDKEGTFSVSYSKDGGNTWTLYRSITASVSDVGYKKLYSFKKQINTRLFTWKLEATSGQFDITRFEGYIYQSGEQRTGK
jgi:hypothetical protein